MRKRRVKKMAKKKAVEVSIMREYDKMNDILFQVVVNITKFEEKGNKAAAKRARAGLMDIKNLCGDLRKLIQDKVNG